jgi:predicted transcriptional regulator
MSRLSKTEKYAILWLKYQEKDIAEISKELKITEDKIKNVLEKYDITNKTINTKSASEPASHSGKRKNLMINETVGKKTKNVSIMTQAASMAFDEKIKKIIPTRKTQTEQNIFRPNT